MERIEIGGVGFRYELAGTGDETLVLDSASLRIAFPAPFPHLGVG